MGLYAQVGFQGHQLQMKIEEKKSYQNEGKSEKSAPYLFASVPEMLLGDYELANRFCS